MPNFYNYVIKMIPLTHSVSYLVCFQIFNDSDFLFILIIIIIIIKMISKNLHLLNLIYTRELEQIEIIFISFLFL
jgi:hypothetical protein